MNLHVVIPALLFSILCEFASAETWPHHAVLDREGKFHLYWKPPEDKRGDSEIVFKVEVEVKGYVGFGISTDAFMPGSDIVTGWVKDGQAFFQDRFAYGRSLPHEDASQDWILMHAEENDTHTILKFRRKLDTCDESDLVIDDSTVRAIYAFSENDPRNDFPFYHHENRGYKSLMLLREAYHVPDDPYLLKWDIGFPNHDVSAYETYYWCKIFKSPHLTEKHHIVRAEPLIQTGNDHYVHHLVLFECVDGKPEDYEDLLNSNGYDCLGQFMQMPQAMQRCQGPTIGWAVGGGDVVFSDHAAMPLEPGPGKYYMLEIHYDNPKRVHGLLDNSALRIYYTPHVRKYDAGALFFGSTVTPRMFIPPGQDSYVIAEHSNSYCIDPEMPEDGIKIFAVLIHTHVTGISAIVRHFRGRKELPPIAEDKNYDFHYQEFRYFKDPIIYMPGDQVTVECTYNTSTRTKVTFGGGSSREEMCLAHVMYYPELPKHFLSLGVPTFSTINKVLNTNFKEMNDFYKLFTYNWTNVDVKRIENHLRYSRHDSDCYPENENRNPKTHYVSYPKDFIPYVPPPSTCYEERQDIEHRRYFKHPAQKKSHKRRKLSRWPNFPRKKQFHF